MSDVVDPDTGELVARKPFADYLVSTNKGRTHALLTEELADLVGAVQATGKSGKLVLTITVAPIAKGNGEQLKVTETVKVTAPQPDPGTSIYFADGAGNLLRDDPNQPMLDGLRVVEPKKIREVTN